MVSGDLTNSPPRTAWGDLTLDCVTDDYFHLGNGHGHAFMVLRHLPLGCQAARLNQSFCEEVGKLLTKA